MKKKKEQIDLSILKKVSKLDTPVIMEIRPLAPLSMVSEMPGSFYKTLPYPSKKMICGLLENMLGWHFDKKLRIDIFNDRKKIMKKQGLSVNIKDNQSGSTYIPLLMDYFDLSEKPYLKDFKGVCYYTDLWSKCYRRSDLSMHLNGCKNLDDELVAEKQNVFATYSSKDKEFWFKENIDKVPCFYSTPTNREYIDVDATYVISMNIDKELITLLESSSCNICYLGNNDGWVHVSLNKNK